MDYFGIFLIFGFIWNLLDFLDSFGIYRNILDFLGFFWILLVSFGIFWRLFESYKVIWKLSKSYFQLIPLQIVSAGCLCMLSLQFVSAASFCGLFLQLNLLKTLEFLDQLGWPGTLAPQSNFGCLGCLGS